MPTLDKHEGARISDYKNTDTPVGWTTPGMRVVRKHTSISQIQTCLLYHENNRGGCVLSQQL